MFDECDIYPLHRKQMPSVSPVWSLMIEQWVNQSPSTYTSNWKWEKCWDVIEIDKAGKLRQNYQDSNKPFGLFSN